MIFWLSYFLTLFHLCGYIIVLSLLKNFRPMTSSRSDISNSVGRFVFIIPVFNEEKLVAQKIKNTLRMTKPNSLIIVVDGGSSDKTWEIASSFSAQIKLLKAPQASKIVQLNLALEFCQKDDVVIVSDCDAMIKTEDVLNKVENLLRISSIGIVGAWVLPEHSLNAEHAYWDKQNRLRYLETKAITASIVVAPFYAFRASLLDKFPLDCVADDVYISILAHRKNLQIIYSPEIDVIEIRSPQSFADLFWHKMRKAHAYCRELLRLRAAIEIGKKRILFLYGFKLLQFFVFPWASIILLLGISQFFLNQNYSFLFCLLGTMFLFLLFSSWLMKPPPGRTRGGIKPKAILSTVQIFVLANLVLLLNSLAYPFYKQDANYRRLKHE